MNPVCAAGIRCGAYVSGDARHFFVGSVSARSSKRERYAEFTEQFADPAKSAIFSPLAGESSAIAASNG